MESVDQLLFNSSECIFICYMVHGSKLPVCHRWMLITFSTCWFVCTRELTIKWWFFRGFVHQIRIFRFNRIFFFLDENLFFNHASHLNFHAWCSSSNKWILFASFRQNMVLDSMNGKTLAEFNWKTFDLLASRIQFDDVWIKYYLINPITAAFNGVSFVYLLENVIH